MHYYDKVSKATHDLVGLLQENTNIDAIYLKMLMRYGLGGKAIDRIIDKIKKATEATDGRGE